MIDKQCWSYCKRTGVSFDEARSTAGLAFADAYERWDGSTAFTTWVWWCVYHALRRITFAHYDDRLQSNTLSSRVEHEDDEPKQLIIEPVCRAPSLLESVINEVGDDSRLVIQLLLETPKDIRFGRKSDRIRIRRDIRSKLSDMGWTFARIIESFSEIKEVLSPIG
jgi:hypothetical protein